MIAYRELIENYDSEGVLGDAVYAMLRDCILDGSLQPGSPMRIDRLAKEIGVSRTPVREAIRRLEAEDFLVPRLRQGLVVKGLSKKELVEIFQVREALESQAAWLATKNLSPRDLEGLESILSEMEEVVDDDQSRFRKLTGEFYLRIAEAARNDRLRLLIFEFQDRVRQFGGSTLFLPGKAKERLEELRRLLAAFQAGDADAAERIVRTHRRRTLELRLKGQQAEGEQ